MLPQEEFREIMTTMGDRWTEEMVDELFYGAPIKEGLFDYIEFTRLLKHGASDKLEEALDNAPPMTPSTPKTTSQPPSSKFPAFQPVPSPRGKVGAKSPVSPPTPISHTSPAAVLT